MARHPDSPTHSIDTSFRNEVQNFFLFCDQGFYFSLVVRIKLQLIAESQRQGLLLHLSITTFYFAMKRTNCRGRYDVFWSFCARSPITLSSLYFRFHLLLPLVKRFPFAFFGCRFIHRSQLPPESIRKSSRRKMA